jgi:hypothetical protein
MALPTLTTVSYFNKEVLGGIVDEAVKYSPEVATLPARSIVGNYYNTLVLTTNPTVSFRAVNTGVAPTSGTYTNKLITCSLINPIWMCDRGVADASSWGANIFIASEAQRQVNATFSTLGKQIWYGTSNDALGFPGLQSQVDQSMVYSAGGSTASSATSAMIVYANNMDNVCLVLGQGGNLALSELKTQMVTPGSGLYYEAYVQSLTAYVGLALGHAKAVARICNIESTFTDADIYNALALAPVSLGNPSGIYMNRKAQKLLRNSRTATNVTGAPAPMPTEVDGIPIIVTENLVSTESVVVVSAGSGTNGSGI